LCSKSTHCADSQSKGGMMNVLEFLQATLPEDGYKFVGLSHAGSSGIAHKAYASLETMAEAIASYDKQTNLTVYHACASYKEPSYEAVVNGETKRKYRGEPNWYKAKAFWADIDCGEAKAAEGKGYVDKESAIAAILGFCQTNGFPSPMLVDSGGGIHCYWLLSTTVGPNSWRAMASDFKAALAAAGLLVDPTRTADLSSLLRPVGTHNRKPGRDPREVNVVLEGCVVSPQEFNAAVQAAVAKYDVIPQQLISRVPMSDLNDDLIGHLGPQIDSSAHEVANHCAQVAKMRDTQGDVSYEQWRGVIGIIKHCVEGEPLAHEWSKRRGETGHSNTDVGMRYESWNTGPATCAFFLASSPGGCEKCPQNGKITSPIQLGRLNAKRIETETETETGTGTGTGTLADQLVTWDPNAPKPDRREFFIEGCGFFPLKTVSMLAGLGGSMKSALALMFGLHGALGKPWNGWPVTAGQTLILSGEDDAAEFQRRTGGFATTHFPGEDMSTVQRRVHCLPVSGLGLRLTEMLAGTPKMSNFVDQSVKLANDLSANGEPPVRLIVIDHARLFIGGDINANQDATAGMEACTRIAQRTGAAVILIAHSPKSAASPGRKADEFGVNDVLGSGAFVDNSRFSAVMAPLVKDEQTKFGLSVEAAKEFIALRVIKSNYSETGRVIYLKKTLAPGWGVAYPVPVEVSKPQKNAPSSLVDRVVLAVAAARGRYTRSKLRNEAGIDGIFKASDKKVRAAIDEAMDSGRLIERPATAEDVSAFSVRLRDSVLDVGVDDVA
jgi:hypothetical protein